MKKLLVPTFESLPPDNPREGVETIVRNTVLGIVEDPTGEFIGVLDWEVFGWKTFVIGGVEGDETEKEAILREVVEETGYNDISMLRKVGPHVQSHFYAAHKGVNRKTLETYFLVKLQSLRKQKVKPEDTKHHKFHWIPKGEVMQTLTVENNQYIWNLVVKGILEDEAFLQEFKNFRGFVEE